MNACRWTARLLLLPLALLAASPPASAQAVPRLVVFPGDVRPNDVFYLAGGGFPAAQPLNVFLFCLDPWHSYYGHWEWTIPAERMRRGSFTGLQLEAPQPLSRSQITCELTARNGDDPYGVATNINIWPPGSTLPRIRFPLHFRVHPATATKRIEAISVSSEPGTHLAFRVRFPHGHGSTIKRATLPWTGQMTLKLSLPQSINRGDRVHVTVQGRLGAFGTTKSIYFLALR